MFYFFQPLLCVAPTVVLVFKDRSYRHWISSDCLCFLEGCTIHFIDQGICKLNGACVFIVFTKLYAMDLVFHGCLPSSNTGTLAYILFLTVCLISISTVSMCEILATFNLMVTSHRRWISGFIILNRGLIASHESKDLIIEIRRIEIGFYSNWVTIKNTSNTLKESFKYQGLKQDLDMGWGFFPREKKILLT